jgi:protein-tyrosine kinase
MSMIEQASKRLEQLGQAGFTVPTSVSRLRVVDDADAQAARRRLNASARALSDAVKPDGAADASDAPAHFSPALRPTYATAPAGAVPHAAPVADLPPVSVAVEPAAVPVGVAVAVSAETVKDVVARELPSSKPSAFFASFAEIENPSPVEPSHPPAMLAGRSAWFESVPVVEAVVSVVSPAPAVVARVIAEPAVAVPVAVATTPAATPASTPASAGVVMPQPPVLSPAADASLVQRAEPSTRVSFDLERLRGVGYLVPDQVRSEMAEQFRHLKRPLLKNARAKTGPAGLCSSHIMITSALPGEGKTFSSINLAMSMAMEVDTAVLLIDADVVRPSVFNRLGINIKPPGLLDLLTRDDLPLHEALVSTNVPKLTLMASGERNQRSTELLASTAMDRLLARLAVEYPDHVVIFDAPPLLLTNESPVLATKVGQVVVVVEASKTRRTVIQQAFAALKNCPVVHSVLNKCDEATEGRRYGYYYG